MTMVMMTEMLDNGPLSRSKPPRRKDNRVILHFDLDCFYAQCVENQRPNLKAQPLGIKQKSILATCNYEARRRGVKKLMLIAEARKICPELVIVDGEDLSLFRDVSKRLYALLRSYSWSGKLERLGLDEVFVDVTDIVTYNVELLNKNSLSQAYFCLSRTNPEQGFPYDASTFSGCVVFGQNSCDGDDAQAASAAAAAAAAVAIDNNSDPCMLRLLLASHLASFLRLKIEDEGFTTSCGISTNKLLAKLVGNQNKPRNQTTLVSLRDDDVFSFMDGHGLRKVPGIGAKITHALENYISGSGRGAVTDFVNPHSMESSSLTINKVRTQPNISPAVLEKLVGASEKGLGYKVWGLLHGVDESEVKPARDVPNQISIEDTYKGLNQPSEIRRELFFLCTSLLRRMQVDLLDNTSFSSSDHYAEAISPTNVTTPGAAGDSPPKWLAYPRTIRLTTRPKTSIADGKPYNWSRASRSAPLPSFVFQQHADLDQVVDRLVAETVLPLFYKLHPEKKRGWNIGLLNVCVANMTGGADAGVANNKDIATMFRRQEDVLREFTAYDDDSTLPSSLLPGRETKRREREEGCQPKTRDELPEFTTYDGDDSAWLSSLRVFDHKKEPEYPPKTWIEDTAMADVPFGEQLVLAHGEVDIEPDVNSDDNEEDEEENIWTHDDDSPLEEDTEQCLTSTDIMLDWPGTFCFCSSSKFSLYLA
ncbi:putative DNA polymerase iota [Podospora didyma]|uniref:DNA polymerase iota n=1 Tax=Podospora didyma TaxID=330526 RepID=A0AAE0NT42_9PEZI|nr:putative DNA polymerase iota [Podospora didyma]